MRSNELIFKILVYIDNNIFTKITLDGLAHTFHYNNYYFVKFFKKEIGYTLIDYINKLKIYYSLKLLNNSDYSILKIAIDNGFYSLEYYSETFKKEIGVSPKKYQKMLADRLLDQHTISKIIEITNLVKFKNEYISNYNNNAKKTLVLSIFKWLKVLK